MKAMLQFVLFITLLYISMSVSGAPCPTGIAAKIKPLPVISEPAIDGLLRGLLIPPVKKPIEIKGKKTK